jgi:26S proteasome regulatory subunit N1
MLDVSKKDQLMKLVTQIVPSQMRHHAEAEACDLLMEVERLDILTQFVDQVGFGTLKCRLNCSC